jgi:hypothetical protein
MMIAEDFMDLGTTGFGGSYSAGSGQNFSVAAAAPVPKLIYVGFHILGCASVTGGVVPDSRKNSFFLL